MPGLVCRRSVGRPGVTTSMWARRKRRVSRAGLLSISMHGSGNEHAGPVSGPQSQSLLPRGNSLINLEAVNARARAAATHRAFTVMAGAKLLPPAVSADDVPELVAEITDLRTALASRVVVGEVLTLRDAVRTELISMNAEYAAQVDAVRAMHSPIRRGKVYCAYLGSDRPDCHTCYPLDGGLGEGHERIVCSYCDQGRVFIFTDEPRYPCATALLLEPAKETL